MKSFWRLVRRAFCHSEGGSDEAIDAFVIASLNAKAFRRGNLISFKGVVIHSIK
jgi:hypothetical protein